VGAKVYLRAAVKCSDPTFEDASQEYGGNEQSYT